jgi:hypothetical protein
VQSSGFLIKQYIRQRVVEFTKDEKIVEFTKDEKIVEFTKEKALDDFKRDIPKKTK